MKTFSLLYKAIDQTDKTTSKVNALVEYFRTAEDEDKVWAIALFSDRRPKRIVTTTLLRQWSIEFEDLPPWLFEASYNIVGDLAETVALILPNPINQSNEALSHWLKIIVNLKHTEEETKKNTILQAWQCLDQDERFLFNKLITGGFRIDVSLKTVVNALSKLTEIEETKITHRLMGIWDPLTIGYNQLVLESDANEDLSRPYPFHLPHALDIALHDLGNPNEWCAERKWDGLRGQLILRSGEFFLWSKDEELVSDKFPELHILKDKIKDDVVIDGEILPFKNSRPLKFNLLQARIGRKNITKKHLLDTPVVIMAYDLLEYKGEDIRLHTLDDRRTMLDKVVNEIGSDYLLISENVQFDTWDELSHERNQSRNHQSVGLMLKKRVSTYKPVHKKGCWWKWKVDPFTINAVLIYAQRGQGSKSKLHIEYTFAVHHDEALVPFTKAFSGLSDEEYLDIAQFIKKNTKEKFGPVSSVSPELVFEIEFDGVAKSTRHKSGVSLRSPKIKRWITDMLVSEINTLSDLNALMDPYQDTDD